MRVLNVYNELLLYQMLHIWPLIGKPPGATINRGPTALGGILFPLVLLSSES